MEPPRPIRTAPRVKPPLERALELLLFRSRWLMAPFYVGLIAALALLLYEFVREIGHELARLSELTAARATSLTLSLIDLSLAGNLVVIVILSGYENFVAKMDTGDQIERPEWMGSIDFSGLKMKLMSSIVAISAVGLLRAFMRLAEDEVLPGEELAWLVGIHIAFVVSAVLLALMDFVISRTGKR